MLTEWKEPNEKIRAHWISLGKYFAILAPTGKLLLFSSLVSTTLPTLHLIYAYVVLQLRFFLLLLVCATIKFKIPFFPPRPSISQITSATAAAIATAYNYCHSASNFPIHSFFPAFLLSLFSFPLCIHSLAAAPAFDPTVDNWTRIRIKPFRSDPSSLSRGSPHEV